MQSSRELVHATLELAGPERAPRQLWTLPWAEIHHSQKLAQIRRRFPDDIVHAPGFVAAPSRTVGDPYEVGEYTDEWGCRFVNKTRGIIGEVKEPLVLGETWEDLSQIHIPTELLCIDKDQVNAFCRGSDRFVLAGACPRPFERLQFLRGTEQLYVDLITRPTGFDEFVARMHDYYCELLQVWAETDVDGLMMMDDWGAQQVLLINPATWRELFKPLYETYVRIAHDNGKRMFMHSDGHILAIIPDLIDLGLDALNSQLFCMGLDELSRFRGKLTFWGEIDRQHLLPRGTQDEIRDAVRGVRKALWSDGGCIAQCEFGAGADPDNVYTVFETWEQPG